MGHLESPKGILSIPLTLRDQLTQAENTQVLDVAIIQSLSPYNIIFGRSAMKKFEVIASTIHGLIWFKIPSGYGAIHSKPLETSMMTLIAEEAAITTLLKNVFVCDNR